MPARIPMTERQRAALLALPDSEAAVVRHHGLDAEDLAAIGTARTPGLCCKHGARPRGVTQLGD